jgi:PKD repeat protein
MKRLYHSPFVKFLLIFLPFITVSSYGYSQCSFTGDSILCENETATYTTSTSGDVYQWNAYPGTVTGTGNSVSVSWSGTGTGTVTLVVKDAYGIVICTASKSVEIYEEPEPIIVPSFVASCSNDSMDKPGQEKREPCNSVCDSTWVTYTVLDHPGSTYAWNITGSATYTPSTTNSIAIFWNGVGAGTVEVTETNAYGCTGSTEICVEVVAGPNASFNTIPAAVLGVVTVCLDQDVIFNNTSDPGDGSDLWSYTWIWGDGDQDILDADASDGSTTHSYSSAGTYSVMMIVENECHCKDTAFITVEVLSAPAPNIECISTVCPGSTVTYYTDASCTSYTWSVTNGTIVSGSTSSEVTVSWSGVTPALLSLTTSGCTPATCPVTNTVEIPVINPNAAIMGADIICQYECETYHIECNIPVDSIIWHFPSGITVSADTINVHDVEGCYFDPSFDTGTIYVEYYHTTPGEVNGLSCGGTAELFVQQRPHLNLAGSSEICDKDDYSLFYTTAATTLTINISNNSTIDTSFDISGAITYSNTWIWGPGIFTITVSDTSDTYCDAPQSIVIFVNEIPPPPLDIIGPDTICPLTAYEYAGVGTSSEYALFWDITGGTSPSNVGPFIPVEWGATGPYILCLTQVDPQTNCKSEPICDTMVSASPLPPPVVTGPDTVCNNGQQSYSASSLGDEYSWSISPAIAGSVVTGQGTENVVIEWNNWTGTATVSVTAYGCGSDSATTTYDVLVIGTPAPNISLPATVCEGAAVTMSTSTTGATFTWDFGDGSSTVSGSTVTHTYNSAGNHIVTLTATYTGNCTGEASTTGSIMVYPKPNITISTPDPTTFCGTINDVNMYVASPVAGTSYLWYESPSTFLASGTSYTATSLGSYYVIGTNSYGCIGTSNVIDVDTMCSTPCKPKQGSFVSMSLQRQGCNTDTFTGTASLGAINPGYYFDDPFGTPSGASGWNASHTFPEPGFYNIVFCVDVPNSDGTGYCEICTHVLDTVNYIADFIDSAYCVNGVDSLTIKFINNTKILSTAPTPSYEWSINTSGTLSTLESPTFTFGPGTYTITLTVDGVCTKVKTITVDSFPNADFIAADSICEGAPLFLTNTSTGTDSSAFWDFGDGASSLIYSPVKVYDTPGGYDITLIVQNSYGCKDSQTKSVTVLPNTLNAKFTFPPGIVCQGDSILLEDSTTGGYPAYSWLWSTIETTPDITVYYTGSYYFDVTDSKGCMDKSNTENFLFNAVPKPQITGPDVICYGSFVQHKVNYPNTGFTFEWKKNGAVSGGASNVFVLTDPPGSYTLTVTVTSTVGCVGYDTFDVLVVNPPNVMVTADATLCEGEEHLLIGSSTSTILAGSYWSTGETNDSIYGTVPGQYTYTVVDTFGCSNSDARTIHPLPDFCGLMTGCYEICDTINELLWHGPMGYSAYQWLYNGSPIIGANTSVLSVPLYQSGTYNLVMWTVHGCVDTSENIDIEFVECEDCHMDADATIDCGPVDPDGNQTYSITVQVNNTLGAGAFVTMSTVSGTITGVSPATLAPGLNTVTGTFTDLPPTDDTVCIQITLYDGDVTRCDTTICLPLPDCGGQCEMSISHQTIDCAGTDSMGNPIYLFCADVSWGGTNGSTLTLTTASGSFVPNPTTINNGLNALCWTYTDLPPYSGSASFVFNVFDPASHSVCKDSITMRYSPCEDSCSLGVFGICAHCQDSSQGEWTYNVELTVDNQLGPGATVSILPISEGYFGTIAPNPIPAGMQTLNVPFTDVAPSDSVICFKVMLTLGDESCWQDVCVYLPECHRTGIGELNKLTYFSIAPNPARSTFRIMYNSSGNSENIISIHNSVGQVVEKVKLDNLQSFSTVNVQDFANGVYFISLSTDGQFRGRLKLVVNH